MICVQNHIVPSISCLRFSCLFSATEKNAKHQVLTLATFNRSLIAAYLLVLNGYANVFHLEGGLYNWFKEGLPVVSEE